MKKAVILFSGGLDSTTCLAIAQNQRFDCYTLNFDYGQCHRAEIAAAEQIAKHYNATHHTVDLKGLGELGGSALTDDNIAVPDFQQLGGKRPRLFPQFYRSARSQSALATQAIPITYVPARNTVFLSIALGYAETLGAQDIFIGANAVDYSGYPDCRPEYIEAFQTMANLATKAAVEGRPVTLHTPLIDLKKSDIIKKGDELNVDYALTVSCYQADDKGRACGKCDACTFRKKGFIEAGLQDPTRYFK